MNYQALKPIAQEHGANTADYLQEPVTVNAGLIARSTIKVALIQLGKYSAVMAAARDYMNDPDLVQIDINHPATQAVLAQLVAGGVLSESDSAELNKLGKTTIPRWQSLGFEACPQEGDIQASLAMQ